MLIGFYGFELTLRGANSGSVRIYTENRNLCGGSRVCERAVIGEDERSEEEELPDRGVQASGRGGSEVPREDVEDSGACDPRDLQS